MHLGTYSERIRLLTVERPGLLVGRAVGMTVRGEEGCEGCTFWVVPVTPCS